MPTRSSSQKEASEITGNASLEDKERILKLKYLYGGDNPVRWGYQMKEDTLLVSANLVPQLQGTRQNAVLEFELVVQSCQCWLTKLLRTCFHETMLLHACTEN